METKIPKQMIMESPKFPNEKFEQIFKKRTSSPAFWFLFVFWTAIYILSPSSIDGESPQPEANLQGIPLYCWCFRSPAKQLNVVDIPLFTSFYTSNRWLALGFLNHQQYWFPIWNSNCRGWQGAINLLLEASGKLSRRCFFGGLEGWWWGGVGTHHVPPPENEHGQKLLETHPTFK